MNWEKETVQMLGRFQPWHDGHTALFKKAHTKTGQVVIILRQADRSEKNPYSFTQREEWIKKALKAEGFTDKDFCILRAPNIVNITYGRDVGYTITQEHLDPELESISATQIRNEKRTNSV